MKIANNSLYIRTLLWAYEKQHEGFTKDEMKTSLGFSDDEFKWVDWMFCGINGGTPLIWTIQGSSEYGVRFYLNAEGMAAAVDYLELKEAQQGGKRATWIAIISIIIGAIVGVIQVLVQLCF